jgi:hypothetical protein
MKRHTFLPLSLLLSLTTTAFAADREAYLKRIPDEANGVAVINVTGLYATARGQREAWGTQQQVLGRVPIPNFVDTIVTASHWQPGSQAREWMLTQASLKRPARMEELARLENSSVEQLGGHNAVLSQRRGYFVEVEPQLVAVVNPPQRRDVLRWLRFIKNGTKPVVSEFLARAVRTSGTAHVIAAIDLDEMLDPKALREWLSHTQTMEKRKQDLDPTLRMLNTLQGVRLLISVQERATAATVYVDFSTSPGTMAGLVRPLFQELLEEMGAGLEDFEKAQPRVEGNAVVLRTNLSDGGFARILTLILGPTLDTSSPELLRSASNPQQTAWATKRYYQTVQKYLDDLKEYNRKASNYNSAATWHDSYAKLIDQLSILNVDPEMVKYGHEVSRKLRLLAASLRGTPLHVALLEGQKRWELRYQPPEYHWGWGYGPWRARPGLGGFRPGGYRYDDNFAEVRQKQLQEIAKDAQSRDKVWRELEDDRNAVRSKMTQKYMIDFDAPEL